MQIEAYLIHYEAFHREFNLDDTPSGKAYKCAEEMVEFATAFDNGSQAEADDEAIDLMNAAISNVIARGIKNPLFRGYQKLQQTSEKYRRQSMGINDKEPAPVHTTTPAVWDLVFADMIERDAIGYKKYGVRLQPHNGRDALKDAYQEALDLVAYLRQEVFERDGR